MGIEKPKENRRARRVLAPEKIEKTAEGVMVPLKKRCTFACRGIATWVYADIYGNFIFLCDIHRSRYTMTGERKKND